MNLAVEEQASPVSVVEVDVSYLQHQKGAPGLDAQSLSLKIGKEDTNEKHDDKHEEEKKEEAKEEEKQEIEDKLEDFQIAQQLNIRDHAGSQHNQSVC